MNTYVGEKLRLISMDEIRSIRSSRVLLSDDFITHVIGACAYNYFLENLLFASYVILSQRSAMSLAFMNALMTPVSHTIKLMIRAPRPWFVDNTFLPTKANYEYGMVSGHSFRGAAFFLTLAFFIFKDYKIKNGLLKVAIYSILSIFAVQLGYARVVMGLHTLDQVLAGFVLGAALHIIICYKLSDYLDVLWNDTVLHRKSALFNVITYTLVLLSLLSYVVLQHHYATFSIDPSWVSIITDDIKEKIRVSSTQKLFTSFIISGAYFGLIVQSWIFTEEVAQGKSVSRINMEKQRHTGFYQV